MIHWRNQINVTSVLSVQYTILMTFNWCEIQWNSGPTYLRFLKTSLREKQITSSSFLPSPSICGCCFAKAFDSWDIDTFSIDRQSWYRRHYVNTTLCKSVLKLSALGPQCDQIGRFFKNFLVTNLLSKVAQKIVSI